MSLANSVVPKSAGLTLELSEHAFGYLKSSADVVSNPKTLRGRLLEDGYLYLPGFLDRDAVFRARDSITGRLASEGLLHPDYLAYKGVAKPEERTVFRPDLAFGNPAIQNLIYGPKVMEFYRELLGGRYVTMISPGSDRLVRVRVLARTAILSTWDEVPSRFLPCGVPYGDISLHLGELMILEGSHGKSDLLRSYLGRDVDTYCLNRPGAEEARAKERSLWDGWLAKNPVALRKKLGGRWLTAGFQVGDVVTFGMTVVHASLDNQTDRIRFSSDSRYQLASEAIDDRWVGPKPPGHSSAGKRGRIC